MTTRVARHAPRTATGPRIPALAFPILAAALAQSMDGLTRLLMPDVNELNPLSAAIGGPASLVLKLALIAYLVVIGWTAKAGAERVHRAVLWVAFAAGMFGAWSNLAVIL